MEVSMIETALEECKDSGIKNILALRGDPPAGQSRWTAKEGGFQCAKDLVEFIKTKYDDFFHISVAGYPEGHPVKMTQIKDEDVENLSETEKARMSIDIDPTTNEKNIWVCKDVDFEEELDYLKEKVDAGACK
jgi:methylenetetrahydrofolate reductase (NADPH)